MQIHELNNYNGNLDSSAYLAVDNGSDTGKISTTELLADTNAAVSQLDTVLNGRIDNIVAGGEAPSTSEIVDARYGADGVTYPSLGAAIRDQVTDLKSDLDDLINTTTTVEQIDETVSISPNWESGYVTSTGVLVSSSDYIHSEISVNSGDVIRFYRADGGVINSARFICVYVGGNVDESLGGANVPIPYTVPNGVSKIVFTLLSDYVGAVCKIDTTIKTLIPVFKKDVESLKAYNKADNYIYKTIETMSANDNFTLVDNLDAKKNTVLEFYGEFQNFIKLDLCHGGAINYGSRVEITSDKVSVYYDNAEIPFISENHNLNISDFVSVRIEQGNKADCYVYVMTKDGLFKSSKSLAYHSCRGAVYATSETAMSNVKLQYILKDMLTDVFIFGDSYITLADSSRYPKHLISYGYDKYLLCGFGGATSLQEILTFREVMSIRKPMYCVWALGMNDGDTSTGINTNWKTCVDEIIKYCDDNGIELILATIPNTPTIENSFKNAYVKASGKRYVDYAKAVGAETSGSSWYSGMLYTDNVHPTELGAKALCERLMIDVPEIMN